MTWHDDDDDRVGRLLTRLLWQRGVDGWGQTIEVGRSFTVAGRCRRRLSASFWLRSIVFDVEDGVGGPGWVWEVAYKGRKSRTLGAGCAIHLLLLTVASRHWYAQWVQALATVDAVEKKRRVLCKGVVTVRLRYRTNAVECLSTKI